MPNCTPISLLLVAGLISAACVLTQIVTLSLYLCTAPALSALISVASSSPHPGTSSYLQSPLRLKGAEEAQLQILQGHSQDANLEVLFR
ncbi:unnamed protein product [Bubo scandiacus]